MLLEDEIKHTVYLNLDRKQKDWQKLLYLDVQIASI